MSSANTNGSLETFPTLPPFPTDIPTAPLLRLSLSELGKSEAESASLFTASKDLGFFYLDLRGDQLGDTLLEESGQLFEVSKALFDEGPEELEKFDYSAQGSYYGYKGLGKKVVDAKGTKDRNEFYNVCSACSVTLTVIAMEVNYIGANKQYRPQKTTS
jgi:isopenicillin N synthase-like dioxygenase